MINNASITAPCYNLNKSPYSASAQMACIYMASRMWLLPYSPHANTAPIRVCSKVVYKVKIEFIEG